MPPLSIAIAGCGPAGLAAAFLLHRDGHDVTLFERFEQPRPIGSGLMIQPSGMAVLAQMGLAQRVAEHGARIDALKGLQEEGRTALDAPYSKLGVPGVFGLGIHRASLFGELYQEVLDHGIKVETGREVVGSQSSGSDARLIFSDGERRGEFDLIVDALGWSSPLAGPLPGTLPFGALWASLPLDANDPVAPNLLEQRYRRAHQMAGILPIGRRSLGTGPEVAFFWSLKGSDYPLWQERGLDAWKADVTSLWPEIAPLLARITSPDQLTFARYSHRTAPHFTQASVVHIGDSWHSASPQLGQGANMALLDAWALAYGLRQGTNLAEGLRLSAAWRCDHVRLYQFTTALFTPLYQSDQAWHASVRDRIVAPLSRLSPIARLQAQLMSGLFGFPLAELGLELPDYSEIASAMAARASSLSHS